MFTKIIPAGDLFTYLKGMETSMGEPREQEPLRIRGEDDIATDVLAAQAPFGVQPRNWQPPHGLRLPTRKQPPSEWVRHCQSHLVHFINCYHESQEHVEKNLLRIVRATEELVLAGLPRDALHFTWYKHGQKRGTHSHGGLVRMQLLSGVAYEPKLNAELRLLFNRLISRRLGYADPLDSRGFRVVHAAWGSWKKENHQIIRTICQAATRAWHADKLKRHEDFLQLLNQPQFKLTIVAQPDKYGRPHLKTEQKGIRIPLYRNTVVVLADSVERPICFKGPACRPNYLRETWRDRLKVRARQTRELRRCRPGSPSKVFFRFAELLEERCERQRRLWSQSEARRVSLSDFEWLNPYSSFWLEPRPAGTPAPEPINQYSPDFDWGEFHHPFVDDMEWDLELDDITDPIQAPLREWIEQTMDRIEANEDDDEPELPEASAKSSGPPKFGGLAPNNAPESTELMPSDSASIPDSGTSRTAPDSQPTAAAKPAGEVPPTRHSLGAEQMVGPSRPAVQQKKRRHKLALKIGLQIAREWEQNLAAEHGQKPPSNSSDRPPEIK